MTDNNNVKPTKLVARWRISRSVASHATSKHPCIVEAFTQYVRPDLWKEHQDAENLDYMLGIGVPEGYGIGGSDWRRGMQAKVNLFRRVREVNANPSNQPC